MFLTKQGHVYSCGTNTHGQLGHGDTLDRPTPKIIELLLGVGPVLQIAAGPSYVFAVVNNGALYSFGSGSNFCLGHGEQHNELQPRIVQTFIRKGIHVVRVSAGDEHAVALDSSGYVCLCILTKIFLIILGSSSLITFYGDFRYTLGEKVIVVH